MVALTLSSSPVADARRLISRGTSDDSDLPRLWLAFLPLSSPAADSATGASAATRNCSGSLATAAGAAGGEDRGAALSGGAATRIPFCGKTAALSVSLSSDVPDCMSLANGAGKTSLLLARSEAAPAHAARCDYTCTDIDRYSGEVSHSKR